MFAGGGQVLACGDVAHRDEAAPGGGAVAGADRDLDPEQPAVGGAGPPFEELWARGHRLGEPAPGDRLGVRGGILAEFADGDPPQRRGIVAIHFTRCGVGVEDPARGRIMDEDGVADRVEHFGPVDSEGELVLRGGTRRKGFEPAGRRREGGRNGSGLGRCHGRVSGSFRPVCRGNVASFCGGRGARPRSRRPWLAGRRR